MLSVLQRIVAQRFHDVHAERRAIREQTLQAMLDERGAHRGFATALRSTTPAIVAEVKHASPSAGEIDRERGAAEIASAYEQGGAAAVSVVVEPRCFAGRHADLASVRAAVRLPVLCKDFVIDEFQLWKAAAFGADAVLLIAAILDDKRLAQFVALAAALSLEAVVEVHTPQELQRAIAVGAHVVGINNRALATMAVDVGVASRLARLAPKGCVTLAESGYARPSQLRAAMDAGINAFLIGEALMRAPDPAAAVRMMREVHAWSE
ncbi:MAG: indole-3-glycerol-phosphate synthase [Candidatus Eremiobacteraeota bacterium]|nr:indole-3-glycerol-phosphate synthase [Candidatus Eremiobacteraeota bacterium]